ncbi:MAG: Anhydro-N-acetylmuramic acid kinase [Cryomorphaceae bacterium]|nr:MAG: Anhydro-N-acetylmuramic acid kinase [Cryomorphaceae bacterium]
MTKKIKYTALGIMSGTSLDGIDLAICTFTKNQGWEYRIEKSNTLKYPIYWKSKLETLHTQNKATIEQANIQFGQYVGEIINVFLDGEKIDFIASHGHTIFHQPENNYTLQIGCGKTISQTTKTTTINDFRSLDIFLNGQGAPLVPIGDLLLFPKHKYCINIGGFANISIKNNEEIIAFDICPANIVLNDICKKLGFEYDYNGNISRKGEIVPALLHQLNQLDFYIKKAPKSLGREWVEEHIFPILKNQKPEDLLCTFCEHTAIQIGKFLTDESALFTGGGVFNSFLMERITFYSKSEILVPNKELIEFKESLIFAFLGVLRLRNEVNCLQSVTGADRDNCGGLIHEI